MWKKAQQQQQGDGHEEEAYCASELAAWDQRETLRPPPYKHAMARIVGGLSVGDALVDALPARQLACHGSDRTAVAQHADPAWVDWDRVERGQALWQRHLSRSFTALSLALLTGFSVARFAEVLSLNGYAQDGLTALSRYRATGFAVCDWFRFSLKDPASRARTSIYTVRAMHGLARRRSLALFHLADGEGVPLSQYDLAEVQLGFSGICMAFIEAELGLGEIPREEAEDMVHVWRVIGFHLGIKDEFNVCASLDDLRACVRDYMAFTPRRLETLRACSHELRRTAMEGFAMQTGLGTQFWRGAFDVVFHTELIDIAHLRPPPTFYPGMDAVARLGLACFKNQRFADLVSAELVHASEQLRDRPDLAKRKLSVTSAVSRFNDGVVWRAVSALFVARRFIALALVVAVLRRLRASRPRAMAFLRRGARGVRRAIM